MAGEKKFFSKRRKSINEANVSNIEEHYGSAKAARIDSSTDEIALPRALKTSFFMRQQHQQMSTTLTEASLIGNLTPSNDDGSNLIKHHHPLTKYVNISGADDANEIKHSEIQEEEEQNDKTDEDSLKEKTSLNDREDEKEGVHSEEENAHPNSFQHECLNEIIDDFKDFDLNKYRDTILSRVNECSVKFKARKHQLETQCKLMQELNCRSIEICKNMITQDPLERILSKVIVTHDQLCRIKNMVYETLECGQELT